ncbi:MAG: hypothetical protein J3Q66DRAFT_397161 [Benniella sp.]|nr:MAG: hypothetical protein J3Q66DRAFT_397161 [Benniella sp.]
MDIPEVRDNVAKFLGLPDLAVAALVCKSWNATFTPVLYHTISQPCYKQSNKEGLVANADSIRHLEAFKEGIHFFSGICTKLKSIGAETSGWSLHELDHLCALVRRNDSIKTIRILSNEYPPEVFLEEVSSTCSSLRKLDISASQLDAQCVKIILDIAVRLESLSIDSRIVFPKSLDKWPHFPSLREITLIHSKDIPAQTCLEIFRKCPELRVLTLQIQQNDLCPASDICDLLRVHCTLIERLNLSALHLRDAHLAKILDGCHRLISVRFMGSKFGELAFNSLSRHFVSLQQLNLEQCPGLTSTMVQQILTSCWRLTSLHATTLDASDILGDVNEEASTGTETVLRDQSQDWVCRNLTTLSVFICGLEGRPLAWHREVLQRLGKLTKLTTLVVGIRRRRGSSSFESRDGLDLRLESGLDALARMKKLTYLGFRGMWQLMGEQDVQWMRDAWPGLTYLEGKLHHDPWRRSKLVQIAKERNICTPYFHDDLQRNNGWWLGECGQGQG